MGGVRCRRLNDGELDAYDVVPPDRARRVRLVSVPFVPGGYAGLTLGPLVFLARRVPDDGSSALLAHELVHVRQWAELGVVGFVVRYLAAFVTGLVQHRSWQRAYRDIPLERQARLETERWSRRTSASRRQGGEALP